jgi:hypothetical protein
MSDHFEALTLEIVDIFNVMREGQWTITDRSYAPFVWNHVGQISHNGPKIRVIARYDDKSIMISDMQTRNLIAYCKSKPAVLDPKKINMRPTRVLSVLINFVRRAERFSSVDPRSVFDKDSIMRQAQNHVELRTQRELKVKTQRGKSLEERKLEDETYGTWT